MDSAAASRQPTRLRLMSKKSLMVALLEIQAWAEIQAETYASLDRDEPSWTPEVGGVCTLRDILSDVGLHLDCPCEECAEVTS